MVCFNGKFFPDNATLLTVQNRSYKWGDGVFETMKVFDRRLLLADLHFERLFTGLRLLQIEPAKDFTKDRLLQNIASLCEQNNCPSSARIRLAVYRNEANQTGYSIEAIPLDQNVNDWQTEGQVICLYPFARKSADAFANLKSANYLPYVLAQRFALTKGADDALVLNASNALCDSSKANIFLIKNNAVLTPALHQGCVNGIMRRVVMEAVKQNGYRLHNGEVTEADLLAADEVFLTNAIQIIRWVKRYKNKEYSCGKTAEIFAAVRATIFGPSC